MNGTLRGVCLVRRPKRGTHPLLISVQEEGYA